MPDQPGSDEPLENRDSQRWWDEQGKNPPGDRPAARRRRRDDDFEDDDEPRPQTNPFAVWALVLGILSFICLLFAGIPALVLGGLGIARSTKAGGKGLGLSIAGIVLGGLSIPWTFVASTALMLPAVQKVREAASNTHTMNNSKQIGLGFMDYQGKNGSLPDQVYNPRGAKFNNGKGLSWRVGLLPFIEQDALYRSFKLTETWDSPANRPWSDTIVQTYANPDEETNETRVQVFAGRGTLFDASAPKLKLSNIPDGTSQTILFAESGTPVPWASPRDIAYVPNGPIPAMGRPNAKFFIVCMADGSVLRVNKNISPAIMHAVIQRGEGTVVPPGWFE